MRRKEFFAVILLVAALGLYLVFHRSDRTNYELPDPPAIAAAEVDRIEIRSAGAAIDLRRKGTDWVVGERGYPADADRVRGLLDTLGKVKLTALVSTSKSYGRYELDEGHRITVRAWKGDRLQRELLVGKPAATFQHTHVMLAGDPSVYHAAGDFRRLFERDEESLRDKSVLRFAAGEIRECRIRVADREIRLARPDGGDAAGKAAPGAAGGRWTTPDGAAVEEAAVTPLLSVLSNLQCETYAEKGPEKTAPSEMAFSLRGPAEYRLDIYRSTVGGEAVFVCESSASPFPFVLSAAQVETLRLKSEGVLQAAAPTGS